MRAAVFILTLLLAAPASAQPTSATTEMSAQCAALPAAPTLPNGSRADAGEMRAGDRKYQAWVAAYQAALTCRQQQAQALEAQARASREDYNSAAATLNATTDSWRAQTAAFAARPHHTASPRQQPH